MRRMRSQIQRADRKCRRMSCQPTLRRLEKQTRIMPVIQTLATIPSRKRVSSESQDTQKLFWGSYHPKNNRVSTDRRANHRTDDEWKGRMDLHQVEQTINETVTSDRYMTSNIFLGYHHSVYKHTLTMLCHHFHSSL